jgi:hypothetical protein
MLMASADPKELRLWLRETTPQGEGIPTWGQMALLAQDYNLRPDD